MCGACCRSTESGERYSERATIGLAQRIRPERVVPQVAAETDRLPGGAELGGVAALAGTVLIVPGLHLLPLDADAMTGRAVVDLHVALRVALRVGGVEEHLRRRWKLRERRTGRRLVAAIALRAARVERALAVVAALARLHAGALREVVPLVAAVAVRLLSGRLDQPLVRDVVEARLHPEQAGRPLVRRLRARERDAGRRDVGLLEPLAGRAVVGPHVLPRQR